MVPDLLSFSWSRPPGHPSGLTCTTWALICIRTKEWMRDTISSANSHQTWIWGLTNGRTPILRGINFPRQVEDHDPPEMATWSKVCCLSLPIQRNCPWQPMLRGASVATAPQHLEQVFSEPSGSLFPESPFDLFKPKKKILWKQRWSFFGTIPLQPLFHFEDSQTKLPIPKPTSSWKMWLRKKFQEQHREWRKNSLAQVLIAITSL